jgi:hypothetical protein
VRPRVARAIARADDADDPAPGARLLPRNQQRGEAFARVRSDGSEAAT